VLRLLAQSGGWRAWLGAVTVLAITAVLVVLDVSVASVHRYWSEHAFTASVLSGLLVLALTLLIVDRVVRIRQLRDQSVAIGAQASVVLAQAKRTADAVGRATSSADERDQASGELRTYGQMLLISAPVLIDANTSRAFLEAAQRVAAEGYKALEAAETEQAQQAKSRLDDGVAQLRETAAPLLAALNRDQRSAVSDDSDSGDGTGT
jgi:hypothetical protein